MIPIEISAGRWPKEISGLPLERDELLRVLAETLKLDPLKIQGAMTGIGRPREGVGATFILNVSGLLEIRMLSRSGRPRIYVRPEAVEVHDDRGSGATRSSTLGGALAGYLRAIGVVPEGEGDAWWAENTIPGDLIVSDEELEVCALLGIANPLIRPWAEFLEWSAE